MLCKWYWLQDVKRSTYEGQLGTALRMRSGSAVRVKRCGCLQPGTQQPGHFVRFPPRCVLMYSLDSLHDLMGMLACSSVLA